MSKSKIFGNRCILLGLVVGLSSTSWAAGPPLVTDDPETPGTNRWEINLAVLSEFNSEATHLDAPLLDINYGLGPQIQLKYELPWVVNTQAGAQTQTSLDRSVVGVKWRFFENESNGVLVSTYPQLTFPTPGQATLSQEETRDFFLPLELQNRLGPWQLNQEVGYLLEGVGTQQLVYGSALGYSVSDSKRVLCEFHGNTRTQGETGTELLVNLGTTLELSEHLGVLVSFGHTLKSLAEDQPRFLSYGGVQVHL